MREVLAIVLVAICSVLLRGLDFAGDDDREDGEHV